MSPRRRASGHGFAGPHLPPIGIASRWEEINRRQLRQQFQPIKKAMKDVLTFRRLLLSACQGHTLQPSQDSAELSQPAGGPAGLLDLPKHDGVEPTNNVSGRDFDRAVIKRKFRALVPERGREPLVESMMTVAATCAKQGRHILSFLVAALSTVLTGGPAPLLLPPTEHAEAELAGERSIIYSSRRGPRLHDRHLRQKVADSSNKGRQPDTESQLSSRSLVSHSDLTRRHCPALRVKNARLPNGMATSEVEMYSMALATQQRGNQTPLVYTFYSVPLEAEHVALQRHPIPATKRHDGLEGVHEAGR